jgi:hypothetical protein
VFAELIKLSFNDERWASDVVPAIIVPGWISPLAA